MLQLQVCRSLATGRSLRMPEFDHRPAQTSEIRGGESGFGGGIFFKSFRLSLLPIHTNISFTHRRN